MKSIDLEHAGFRFTAGVGRFGDGRLAEVFITSNKTGTALDVVLRNSAILLSFAIQFGAGVEAIRGALVRNGDGSASGPVGALLDKIEAEGPAP